MVSTVANGGAGHGDIAEVKRAKETKYRRDQEEPLDGLPCWRPPDEEKLVKLCKQATRALCFAAVRQ